MNPLRIIYWGLLGTILTGMIFLGFYWRIFKEVVEIQYPSYIRYHHPDDRRILIPIQKFEVTEGHDKG